MFACTVASEIIISPAGKIEVISAKIYLIWKS